MFPSLWTRMIRPFTVNDVTTAHPGAYPELQPVETTADPDEIREAVRAIFSEQGDRWHITEESTDQEYIEAEIETALWGFVDDITVRFDQSRTKGTEVVRTINIRSRSRIGKGDLGKNARNIRILRRGLTERLPAVSHADTS